MVRSESVGRRVGLAATLGLGGLLLVVHVRHALEVEETVRTVLLGALASGAFAVVILAGAEWLRRADLDGTDVLRVGCWCVAGALVLAVGAGLTILYERAEGVVLSDTGFVVANAASAGGVLGLVVGVYDVRKRRAHDRATRREQQLSVLNRLLRHDIRNAATVIQGRAELLADGADDAGEHAAVIQRQSRDLVEIGEQARELERTLRHDEVELVRRDVTGIVESCVGSLRQDFPSVEVDLSLPDAVAVRSHPLLELAVANVLENAVVHNDAEDPRIEVSVHRVDRGGARVVDLRIADNGPGIPASEIDVLHRGYETPLAHSGGLGLWLVDWLVTAAGGEVDIETHGQRGSVVHLYLVADDAP